MNKRKNYRTALDNIPMIIFLCLVLWAALFLTAMNVCNAISDWKSNREQMRINVSDWNGGILSERDIDYLRNHGVKISTDAMRAKYGKDE